MSAINFILSLARKILARESKGITTIPNRMAVEQKAGEIATTLQNAGLPLNRADEFIKSEQDLTRILNMIESTPPVTREVPSGIRSTQTAKVFDMEGKEIPRGSDIMGGKAVPGTSSRDRVRKEMKEKYGFTDKRLDEIENTQIDEKMMDDLVKQDDERIIKERLEKGNKEGIARIRAKQKMVEDAIDNASPGFVKGDRKYNAQLVAEDLAERKFGKEFYDLDQRQQMDLYDEALEGLSKQTRGMPDPEDFAQGGRAGFSKGSGLKTLFNFLNENSPLQAYKKYLKSVENRMKAGKEAEVAGEVIPIAAGGALITNQMKKILKKMNEEQKKKIEKEAQEELRKDMKKADGGIMRVGFKDGMTRRTFLKILGGAMAIPIVGRFLKPLKTAKGVTKVPMIKTDDVAGKPEWFDALVNKVIVEGDDVTKKFATGERQSIHQKTLDDGSVVRVTEDIDDGAVRVEYESDKNVFEDPVQLEYKKPLPDEGAPDPKAEFTTAESGPVGRRYGPDDYEIDVDEVGGTSIRDLDSDVSKLKEYATGKKPTMTEIVQNKKRRDKAKAISEDPEAQSDAVIRRQGEAQDYDYDDYASGGIARMLGE